MKKLLLILLPLILCSVISKAQTPNWMWSYAFGGSGYQYANGAAIDDSDHIYVAGRFAGSITIGAHSATAGGAATLYISKFDTAGDCLGLYTHAFTGGYDYPQSLCIDYGSNNHIYDVGVPNSGDPGGYVIKYTSGGTPIYDPTFGTTGYSYGQNAEPHGIAADSAGNVYITGETGGGNTVFGDSSINYAGTDLQEMFLAKMDNTGNFLWAVGANGLNSSDDGYDVGRNVAVDYTGQYVYVVGSYTGTPSFHSRNPSGDVSGPASENGEPYANMFLAKYDTAGNLIWVTYGVNAGIPDNTGNIPWSEDVDGCYYGIAVDSCDNVFLAGHYFYGTATFGQISIAATNSGSGHFDGFVAACNSNGQWQWAKDVGSNSSTVSDLCGSIAIDKNNDVYVGGWISGTANFGDGITTTASSSQQAFVAKYANSTGDVQWVLAATGSGTSSCAGVAVDRQKFVYIGGSYSGSITIGSNNLTNNSFGLYIAKIDTITARYIVPVVDSSYCAGETTTITYATVGTFNSGNVFTAELSNDSGSFIDYQIIGSANSDTSGTITIIIPAGATQGSNYLIRVVSSSPATSSYVNGCGAYYHPNVYINNFNITIGNNISVAVSPVDTSLCNGGSVQLSAGGTGLTYKWYSNTDTSSLSATDTFTVSPTTTTTYYVAVGNGTCSGIDSAVVKIGSASTLTINVTPPSKVVCSGTSATLMVDSNGTNYNWTPSYGLNITTGDSIIASPSTATTYTVTGNDSLGCAVTNSVVITTNTDSIFSISPQPAPLFCSGLNAAIWVDSGGSNFSWSPSAGLSNTTGDTVIATPLSTTTYTVIGNNSSGCAATGSIVVTIIPSPNKPTFYQHGDTLTSSAATDNQWYMNGMPINGATSQNLIINNTSPDSFFVAVVSEANGCSSPSDTVITTGINQLSLIGNQLSIYPNPFNNDIFININSSAPDVKDWSLQVVDVLGQTVYSRQSLNYSNDIDLSNLPGGVYFITVLNKTARAVFPVVKQN